MQAQVIVTTIQGLVKDSASGENLINATVKLIRVKDSMGIRQTISNKNGFVIDRVSAGKYFLKLSYIGYKDTIYVISIGPKEDSLYNMGTLIMAKSADELMEVIVKYTIPPVITKSDTIVYNAAAFKTRPNATVEELLKKLPGIEVDKDGNVTFQGERVQKIYLDGKEFFLNDPKLATQNLLADMVQKVEAFDEKSERAKLTGIPDDKPGKAINLRLKPDKKNAYFGNVQVGYVSPDRSNITVSANYLKGDAIAMLNAGNNNSGSGRVSSHAKNISLNYQNILNQNLRFGTSYVGNINNNRSWSYNQRQTFFPDSSLLQEKEGASVDETSNHIFNFGVNYKIDSFSTLVMSSGFGLQYSMNKSHDIAYSSFEKADTVQPINSAFIDNETNENSWNGIINLNYNRRFRKLGRYLGLQINSNKNQRTGNGELTSLTMFYNHGGMNSDSVLRNQRFTQYSDGFALELKISYTEPVGKSQVLDFYYNLSSSRSESNKQANNYNPITGKYDEPDSISSNGFENTNQQHNFGIGYNNFRSSKFRYQAGLGLLKAHQQNLNKTGNQANIAQTTTNFFPRASLMYSLSKQKSVRVAYNGRSRQPVITELQPVPDFSNPLLIRIGNPSLKPEFNNEITAEYKDFNAKKMSSFTLNVNFRNTLNRIVNSVITNAQGIQEHQYVNMNGDYGIGGSVSYDMPLVKKQGSIDIRYNTSISYYRDANLVNKELNKRQATSVNQRLVVNYHFVEKLFASFTGNFNLTSTRYSIQKAAINTLISHRYSGNISYEFPGQFMIYTDFSMLFNNTRQIVKAQNPVVWNATLTKKIFKNNKGELQLSVIDILNDKNDFNQNIGDNYIETTSTEVVKRIFNLSFVYRFRGNKL